MPQKTKEKDRNSKHKRGLLVRQQLQVVTGTVTAGNNNFPKNLGANSKFQVQEGLPDITDPQICGPTV